MSKFNYDDLVTANPGSPKELRPGERAWVCGITEPKDRRGAYLQKFPTGTVYLVEFEDGSAVEAIETDLMLVEANPK